MKKIWKIYYFQLIKKFKLSTPQLQISKISSELAICRKFDEKMIQILKKTSIQKILKPLNLKTFLIKASYVIK